MATMKENKGKGLASDEAVHLEKDVLTQCHPTASKKRKTISRKLDTGSHLSCRGNKKPKHGLFTLSNPLVIETNPSIPSTASNQPLTNKNALPNASSSLKPFATAPLKSCPLTLLRSKGHAWDWFR